MRMKSLGLMAAAVVALGMSASQALATSVTYSTKGGFGVDVPAATDSISAGGMTIKFVGVTSAVVDASPTTFGSLGEFDVSGSGAGIFAPTAFTLEVDQAAPPGGGGQTFGPASLAGTITGTSSGITVIFTSPLTLSFPSTPVVTYTITSPILNLVPPSTNNGQTTIQGQITAAPLPSAAWMGMSTLLAVGVAGAIRKRVRMA